ncbi:lachesin isoform X2 [Frankliniella occidentalis]|uniref:Lachesin isoform X2 n=1 Tax=Frankliniella occidentalis TaxID=133901 RepID=A0A6J1SI47_FRAOC|nr:lachesin isoform X2 [Frankliniella occidentalis]
MGAPIMHLACLLIFSLCCSNFALAQRTPTISYISQEQIKDIGGTVELVCSVLYASDYPVLWMKVDRYRQSDPLPISTGSSLIIRDSRFAIRTDQQSSTYTLQIKDIQETDAGYYQCQVIISINNKISAEVELQVRRPPVISDNSTRSIVVSEGQPVRLECYANGWPIPRISWRRENNAILPTGGSIYKGNVMRIAQIRKEDRGTYYCVAENGVEKGVRRNIAVEVEFAPVITVPRPRLGQALQYDMDLECHVEAYPPPAIVWVKDDIQLSNNQHYSISHFATADEFTDTTIRVITVEKRQYGQYVCKAANKLGTAEKQVELFETIIPICPPACGTGRYAGGADAITTSVALVFISAILVLFHRNFNSRH